MTEKPETEALPIDYTQLSQVRVPLDQADDVFAQKGARGRTLVVLVPVNPLRIRNEFVTTDDSGFAGGSSRTGIRAGCLTRCTRLCSMPSTRRGSSVHSRRRR